MSSPLGRLIPGTALVVEEPQGAAQPEQRGTFDNLTQGHVGPPLFAGLHDTLAELPADERERARAELALRALIGRGLHESSQFFTVGGQTDATTGNFVIPLYDCPQYWESHVTNVLVDTPNSATITPAAPFANAASWAFLASIVGGGPRAAATAAQLRAGMIAFAPNAAGGPIVPGQWTFNDSNAPVLQGGDTLYFVLVGGSIAAILAQQIQVTVRLDRYSRE
jgi:hypothetical protein